MIAYFIYFAIHLLMLMASIGISAISVAFPDIIGDFGSSVVLTGWVISIYLLVSTVASVLVGKVAEILGKKKTFLICTGLFTLGSLLSALAPNIYYLIFFRFIQSVGGGGSTPVIVGIVADIFPRSRQKAVGFSMSVATIGAIIGPTIGSWLITSFGWRSIFWFNVPFGILTAILVMILLKGDKGRESRVDLAGVALFSAAIFAVMIGLSQVNRNNTITGWLITALLFVSGFILIAIFIRHETKTRDPIIDLSLFRQKPFAAGYLNSFIVGIYSFGLSSMIPLYCVSVYHLTTIQTGLILTIRSIGMILATVASGIFVMKWGYRRPLLLGSSLVLAVILILGLEPQPIRILGQNINALAMVCFLGLIMGVGMGIVSPASINACVDLAPQKTASITGVLGMLRQGGGAIEISLITLIIQYSGNATLGFEIAFIATGMVVLLVIPAIFAMPARAAATKTVT